MATELLMWNFILKNLSLNIRKAFHISITTRILSKQDFVMAAGHWRTCIEMKKKKMRRAIEVDLDNFEEFISQEQKLFFATKDYSKNIFFL